jgi:hypothetical protein
MGCAQSLPPRGKRVKATASRFNQRDELITMAIRVDADFSHFGGKISCPGEDSAGAAAKHYLSRGRNFPNPRAPNQENSWRWRKGLPISAGQL